MRTLGELFLMIIMMVASVMAATVLKEETGFDAQMAFGWTTSAIYYHIIRESRKNAHS